MLDLAHAGKSQRQIATELRVTRGYVQKVLEQYNDKHWTKKWIYSSLQIEQMYGKFRALSLL